LDELLRNTQRRLTKIFKK